MTYQEAKDKQDKYKSEVIGENIFAKDGVTDPDYEITDVLICPKGKIAEVFTMMWDNNLSNEQALPFIAHSKNEFEVRVIAYHILGDANLYHETLDEYLQHRIKK